MSLPPGTENSGVPRKSPTVVQVINSKTRGILSCMQEREMERQTHQKPPWARSRPQLEKAESQGAGITEVISGGTMGDMEIRQISRCDNSSKSMFWRLWHVEF